jgi:hypothetical protein
MVIVSRLEGAEEWKAEALGVGLRVGHLNIGGRRFGAWNNRNDKSA